ncbi:arylformamidase [Rhodoligotrophos appendicifer]|uniref:alpha/beta hydrolase n=1 Tax=Rhodoligotrophos appendicifer TaxID=987056 RepID=UPI001FE856FE|nr:alpha/beta hydrolase [Rhodoligotrophos appendicifer]
MEIQYNNRLRNPDTPQFIERWTRESERYRSDLEAAGRAELGLKYGSTSRQVVDMFWPEHDTGQPLTVFIHGGYWQLFGPSLFSHLARGANERGLPMALIGYDLCPTVTLEEIVREIRDAVRFLVQRYDRRLVLSGHSAGGHLVAAMLATDWRAEGLHIPDPIIAGLAISGVFDLAPLMETSMNDALRLTPATARSLSPIHWQPPRGKMIDAWVGGAESEEFNRQSQEFVDRWRVAGADARCVPVAAAHHFTIIAALEDPDSAMVDRLSEFAHRPAVGTP